MKLKTLLLALGLSLLPLSFTNAGWQEFDLGFPEEINSNVNLGYTLELESNANFLLDSSYKIIQFAGNGSYPSTRTYFWNDTGMYVLNTCQGGYNCNGSILGQGYYNYVNIVDLDSINENLSNVPEGFTPISDFINNPIYNNPDKLYIGGYENMQTASLCFGYSDINTAVCFTFNRSNWNNCGGQPQYCTNGQLSYITNSQGYTSQELEYLSTYATSSPFTASTPSAPNVNVGICPTVKTLLSTSNLTPAVCYAGYDANLIYEAGDNTPIQFGSGITIFETYDLFSGNMTIQNWYDTYWNYYQNISWNGYPFYGKPKALLGIETARQIAGTSAGYKGSYVILNYCWYLLGNFDENASTCVLPKLDSVYSGIIITNQDKQDLIDDLNDDYDIRRPGSGSIYDGVWSGNGGGAHSRGEECNSIPCMFNKFYDMFNTTVVDDVDFTSAGGGVLPAYIGLAFVVVVLFYIFKR